MGSLDFAITWVRDILLWYGRQVNYSIGDRVGSAKGDNDTRRGRGMRNNDVPARVCKENSGTPGLEKLVS